MRRLSLALCIALALPAAGRAQSTPRTDTVGRAVVGTPIEHGDSGRRSVIDRARTAATRVGRDVAVATRAGARLVLATDDGATRVTMHADAGSAAVRRLAPVAFWLPVATAVAAPLVWAEEAEDGHETNAAYARSATTALVLGLIVSRATKHLVHRARPCTGEGPDVVFVHPVEATRPQCPRGSGVSSYTSFFSEHAMTAFAIASAAAFEAQQRASPQAELITVAAFSTATVFAVSRVYQRHHWLSDVVVGAAVGTASGFLASRLSPGARPTARAAP